MLLEKIRKFFSYLEKMEKKKWFPVFLIFLFSLFFLITRAPRLSNDVINPDGVNWHYRSEQFVVGLKTGQLEKTYQHYHPGVTLMWISGTAVEVFKIVSGIKSYDVSNFQQFEVVAKASIIFAQFVLSLVIIFVLAKLVGFYKSFLTVTFFTFEPFFVGNSRLYHLDVLLTLILFLGLIFAFINLKRPSFWMSVLTALFLSLAFLTKSVAVGALFFVVFYYIAYFISSKKLKKFLPYIGLIILFFGIFTFLLLPALWENPIYYITLIFKEAERVGIRKGHGQIILGEYTRDAGVFFYPLVVLVKVSPFLLTGVLVAILSQLKNIKGVKKVLKNIKEKFLSFGLYITVFYLGYISFMTFPTKKLDRYMVVIFPFLAYLAVVGYRRFWDSLKGWVDKITFKLSVFLLAGVFWVLPLASLYPFYFTYASPIFGSAENANKVIAQKPFGVGIVDLKNIIIQKYDSLYGEYPDLGFVDIKPMRAIYPNSKVFDVRVNGPGSYDLLILGVNEEMPEKVVDSDEYFFQKDMSLWINGLEYWRIYVKRDRF